MVTKRTIPRSLARGPRGGAAVVWLCFLALFPADAAPRLVVPKSAVEVGPLIAGETTEAAFPIENTGTEPLRIAKVATSCGCTTTSYPETLQPGEKGVLKAQLVSSPLWIGRIEKEITVHSNDLERPSLALRLIAEMRPLFDFSPVNPVVATYRKGEVIRKVVTVTAAADPMVQLLGIGPGSEAVEARILPAEATDAPGTARVEVTVRPPKGGGDLTEHVTLQTSHGNVKSVPLILRLLSHDGVTAQPPAIYWAGLSTGPAHDGPRLITLLKRSGAFRVLSARAEHAALSVEVPSEGESGEPLGECFREIVVRYKGGLPKGMTQGTLRITTDDPDFSLLSIPYQLTIQ